MTNEDSPPLANFPTTQWSQVFRARKCDESQKRLLLDHLLRQYLPALRAHLTVEKGLSTDHAEDVLQGFVADKILDKDLLCQADHTKGKFRTFLLRALNNYLISLFRRAAANKRAPNRAEPLDPQLQPDLVKNTKEPAQAFDLAWARRVLSLALDDMKEYCRATDRRDVWGVFDARVLRPVLEQETTIGYEQLVQKFGFRSPRQASNVLVTAKRIFRRHLRQVVSEYTETDEEVEEELRDLRRILENSDAGSAHKVRR